MSFVAPHVLWITPGNWSNGQEYHVKKFIESKEFKCFNFSFIHLEPKYGAFSTRKSNKNNPAKSTVITDETKRPAAHKILNELIDIYKPQFIVINHEHFFRLITGKKSSLAACRGSMCYLNKIPTFIFDYFIKLQHSDSLEKAEGDIRYLRTVFQMDVKKLYRFATNSQINQPQYNNYVAKTVSDIKDITYTMHDQGVLLSFDLETLKGKITCVGFSCLLDNGTIESLVIPIIDPTKENCCYWETQEQETQVWYYIKQLLESPITKTCQNGIIYDTSFLLHYGIGVNNLYLDTYSMIHAIWAEMPRSLGFICSLFCDYYFYWKDETDALSATDDKTGTKIWLPQTEEGLEQFWLYNGLDCYWTLIATINILNSMPDFAFDNYIFALYRQLAIGLHATMRGTKISKKHQYYLIKELENKSAEHLLHFKTMVPIEDFNPRSTPDVQNLIYDILMTKPLKKRGRNSGKSTDKRILAILRIVDPFLDRILKPLTAYKEAENDISKYGPKLLIENNRFLCSLDADGTSTTRFSSARHPRGFGSNKQNIRKELRDMFIPDPGYIFCSMDFSQSDFYYTSYYLNDPEMISICEDPRDTHCLMASHFFSKPYEKIYEAYKRKEDWVVHSTKGVRQNQKRISYGANYLMAGATLYVTMGHEAIINTALAMGRPYAQGWKYNQIIEFCSNLIRKYWDKFEVGRRALDNICYQTHKEGGMFTRPWGDTKIFLGNALDAGVKRKIAAEIGQAGTAGAINRALCQLITDKQFKSRKGIFLGQTHDDIKIQVPLSDIGAAWHLMSAMQQPLTLHDKTFIVPSEVSFGFSWGKGMVEIDQETINAKDYNLIIEKCIDKQKELGFLY